MAIWWVTQWLIIDYLGNSLFLDAWVMVDWWLTNGELLVSFIFQILRAQIKCPQTDWPQANQKWSEFKELKWFGVTLSAHNAVQSRCKKHHKVI